MKSSKKSQKLKAKLIYLDLENGQIEELRKRYPVGTRVELIFMDDIQSLQVGTRGTVRGVDDAGSIMILWDNGSFLSLIRAIRCWNQNTESVYDSRGILFM